MKPRKTTSGGSLTTWIQLEGSNISFSSLSSRKDSFFCLFENESQVFLFLWERKRSPFSGAFRQSRSSGCPTLPAETGTRLQPCSSVFTLHLLEMSPWHSVWLLISLYLKAVVYFLQNNLYIIKSKQCKYYSSYCRVFCDKVSVGLEKSSIDILF